MCIVQSFAEFSINFQYECYRDNVSATERMKSLVILIDLLKSYALFKFFSMKIGTESRRTCIISE